jgi:EAL domain-containing protein (putative c-di-GMP-specific phosphodiesterase class I)
MVILGALINLATGLGMIITAEGVETQAQLDWLKSANCSEAQGYLISRPLPVTDLRCFMRPESKSLQVA